MKKFRAVVAALAICTLAGCDFFNKKDSGGDGDGGSQPTKKYEYTPDVIGGGEEEKTAIYEALNKKPICNQFGSSTNEIFPENKPILSEDEGDGIKLTTSQAVKVGSTNYTVSITWDIPEQLYFKELLDSDSSHKLVEIAYQGYGVANGEFTWSLKKMECNGAYAEPNLNYKAICQNEKFFHEDYRIADIYAFHDYRSSPLEVDADGTKHYYPTTWDIVDYEYHSGKSYSPYFRTNNPDAVEKQYLYLNVIGKVIYLAPDGNWGLLADGENVLEFYAGSAAKSLTPTNWPNFSKEYVKISANMGHYHGNVQYGFLTKVAECTAAEKALIEEPTMNFRQLTQEKLESLKVDGFTAQLQACEVDGVVLEGSLRQVTGTLVANSIATTETVNNQEVEKPLTADTVLAGQRFTFKLQVGTETMTVAYDYHADKTASNGLFNALQAALKKGAGTSITIKGTMRYSGNNSSPFVYEGNNGVWNITPFDVSHVSA